MTNHIEQFAKKISTSLLLTKEAKQRIKERMGAGEMTQEEIKQILELLSLEKDVKKRLNQKITEHFNR